MNEQKNSILTLLNNNSSKVYSDYNNEADILNYEIGNPDVYNVAVVAKYGAGKSSAINTYLKRYRSEDVKKEKNPNKLGEPTQNQYVRISLSTFNNEKYNEQAIERSILQQLLYSRKKNELPNSKIERTNKTSIKNSLLITLFSTLFVFASVITGIEFSMFKENNQSIGLFGATWVKYLFLALSLIFFAGLFFYLFHRRLLKRFKYKDLEADFISDDKRNFPTDLINKFIDEVLYFFECIDVNLVIFEDLDRLETTKIFAKLRELNLIINNSKKKSNKITFLYAVKDDLFESEEERAKFFDFILPIIPVINPNTTYGRIDEKLTDLKNENMKLSSRLMRGVSVYIPDMRILNNTFNDYIIMFDKIIADDSAPSYLKADKLFALCLYKNLFPYDYALVEKNDGLIPKIINMETLHARCLEKIENDIRKLKNDIEVINKTKLNSLEELFGIFIYELGKLRQINYGGSVDPWTIKTFKDLDFSTLRHPKHLRDYYNYGIDLNGKSEILAPNGERFEDLEQKIIDKNKGLLEQYKEEIAILEKRKQEILNWNFEKIVLENGIDFCFKNDTFKTEENKSNFSELQTRYLKFMILQGFIDEHYIEYTSNYKSKLLSPSDTNLIQRIQSGETNYHESVDNINQVLKYLDDEEFLRKYILFDGFLDNLDAIKKFSLNEKDKKYKNIITLLKNLEDESVKSFVINYINSSHQIDCIAFLKEMLSNNIDYGLRLIREKGSLMLDRIYLVLEILVQFNSNFKEIEEDRDLKQFVSEHNFTWLEEVNANNNAFKFLNALQPKMLNLLLNKDSLIQKYIIENNMYEINIHNLEVIFLNDKNKEVFFTSNYSFILQTSQKDYILRNLEIYVKSILLDDSISCVYEEQKNIEQLLKNEEINIDIRKLLLNKANILIGDISEYPQELYDGIIKNNLIVPSWFNLEEIYEKLGFTSIKSYLEGIDKIEGDFFNLEGIDKDTPLKLIDNLIINLDNMKFEHIAKYIPTSLNLEAFTLDKAHDSNLSSLIKDKHIDYNVNDLNKIFELPKSLNEYLYLYNEKIMEDFEEFFEEAMSILASRSYYDKTYTSKDNAQEIIFAVLNCSKAELKMKKKLIDKCSPIVSIVGYENVMADYIVKYKQSIPKNILNQLAECGSISEDKKKKILMVCSEDSALENNAIEEYLKNINGDYEQLIMSDVPLIVKSLSIDDELFETLKIRNLFSKKRRKDIITVTKK